MKTLIKPAEIVNTGIYRPAPTTARFDINIISPHVKSAEERFIIPILGVNLYNDMVDKQNAAESNYNPAVGAIIEKFPLDANYEEFWVNYLMRYVAYSVFYEALPYIGLQVSSKGVFQLNSETAENLGINGVRFIQDNMMQRLSDLEPLIKSYLCENKADFTLYNSSNCPDNECHCGYFNRTGKHCHTCETGKNSSTNIIFY